MDKGTYNQAKTASKMMSGVGAAIFGGKNKCKAGAVAGSGGALADQSIGKDYGYTLTFKCK